MTRKKILLVDDSRVAVMMEKTMLMGSNFEVEVARDGQEGLERALAAPPDLILMDLCMPRLDGISAVRELRKAEATRDIPIIMVTSKGDEERVKEGFEAGCSAYVTKPIDPALLLKRVNALLARSPGEGTGEASVG